MLPKTSFLKVVLDVFYVERFDIDHVTEVAEEESIITIFKTDVETKTLLSKFGINLVDDRIIDNTTLRLHPEEVKILVDKAPYLIAMNVVDFSKLTKDDIACGCVEDWKDEKSLIPKPTNEPVIGVIDTQFDESVYFHEWVEYESMLDPNIDFQKQDYYHGTEVSSIIVDGPYANPNLDDGCGRFRVRHFGVATHGHFSSFTVLRLIGRIVATNRDIKVWNLSLGLLLNMRIMMIYVIYLNLLLIWIRNEKMSICYLNVQLIKQSFWKVFKWQDYYQKKNLSKKICLLI